LQLDYKDLKNMNLNKQPNFDKSADGLIPAIVQDANTNVVLMLGYMNQAALDETLASGKVTFFSRSKNRLWTKGETTQHYLNLVSIALDCDQDTLLVKVNPDGPTCHTGADTCWDEKNESNHFIAYLEGVIREREKGNNIDSYTFKLLQSETSRIAQKVGEEGLEVALEAMKQGENTLIDEAADLIFHLLVLLRHKGRNFDEVLEKLKERHR
jgi:phosphoribosyl-ATP pyrophosphohydrolase/phosphoribosyl-AMP cyclohydrolase